MDFVGVTRTIDHAVYMLLNSLAIVLWRLDAALIGISLFSYNTQDWLTGADGGVWQVLNRLVGPEGIFGLATWQAFLLLALMLFGFSRVARPFLRVQPVDLGRLFIFGVLSYVVISQGSELMQSVEAWRAEAGSYMYEQMSGGETVTLEIPGSPASSDEPLYAPSELDGRVPIRGWEAVATSYFLVSEAEELHAGVPARDFRRAYCLYDPNEPIDEQTEENSAGCSPQKAWDEWDQISLTQPITQVWGIPLPGSYSLDIPIVQEHPENRQLAIRQAQAGVARLAMGPVVALFPLVEANIALMLALAASFIYLSLPIVLLFGFFMVTESMARRLLMQLLGVILRTLILNGLAALFLMLLMGVSVGGSLTSYLGLVGVGLIGGFLLMRFAAATMKESFSQALGAVGGIWLGATTATLGPGAARPAQSALGLAKLGATVAVLGAARGRSIDLAEAGLHSARSGVRDLNQSSPAAMSQAQTAAGRLPAPLARLAQSELSPSSPNRSEPAPVKAVAPLPGSLLAPPSSNGGSGEQDRRGEQATGQATPPLITVPSASGGVVEDQTALKTKYNRTQRRAVRRAAQQVMREEPAGRLVRPDGKLTREGVQAIRQRLDPDTARVFSSEQGQQDLANLVALPQQETQQQRQSAVEGWVRQSYRAQGQGQQQARESGRTLLGEELSREAERAMARHSQTETQAVLDAARQAQTEGDQPLLGSDGRLNAEAAQAVRKRLDDQTTRAFAGRQGQRDLLTLSAVALQQDRQARPEEFRQVTAQAQDRSGEQAPGRAVPRALGLDPVAAGAHFAGLNRFVRLSEQAGLSAHQREQLLAEVKQGQISADLRRELESSLRRQQREGLRTGLKVDDLVAGAQALPETLAGPGRIHWPDGPVAGTRQPQGKPVAKTEPPPRRQTAPPPERTKASTKKKAGAKQATSAEKTGETT